MSGTLAAPKTVHSLRLHFLMEKQQRLEIGQRIRELRENSAETNRSIAEYVGVGERSVAAWLAGGGIAWENAKKVAELFDVDVDYIWRGQRKDSTPDVMAALSPSATDDEAVELLHQVLDQQGELLELVRELHADREHLRRSQESDVPKRAATRKRKPA